MISEILLGELVEILCSPCSGNSPGIGGSLAGGASSAAASQDAPVTNSNFPGSDSSELTAGGIGTDVATGLATDSALEIAANAAGASGMAGGVLSALGAAVSGSQLLAEGATTFLRNDGRGMGGNGRGGKEGMDLAMGHLNKTLGGVQK